jgi:WD40 repeat protein
MNLPNLEHVKIAKSVSRPGDFLSVVREADSDRVWLGHTDFRIYAVDFTADKPQAEEVFTDHTSYVSSLALLGETLISASWDRTIRWWNIHDRKPVRSVDAHQRWVRQLDLHAASNRLASVSDDMTCKLWEADSGKLVRSLTGFDARIPRWDYPNKVFACALSPDGKHVAAADETCRVVIWEMESGREATRFNATGFFKEDWDRNNHPYGGIRCLRFSPDGRTLAIAGMENSDVAIINGKGLLQAFDWQAGEKTYEQKIGSNVQLECLAYHPQAAWLVTAVGGGENGGNISFFDPAQPKVLKDAPATMQTFGFAWGENAESFYTAGRGKALKWHFANS